MEKTIWVCGMCGSQNVEERVWVNMNTGDCNIGEAEFEDTWCVDCDKNTNVEDINDYKTTEK